MKKLTEVLTSFCDVCGKQQGYLDACLRCGKEMCYECAKTLGKTYRHSVWAQGSGDGHYCAECDAFLLKDGTNALHRAYRAIELLRLENEAHYIDFKRRSEKAEAALKALQS